MRERRANGKLHATVRCLMCRSVPSCRKNNRPPPPFFYSFCLFIFCSLSQVTYLVKRPYLAELSPMKTSKKKQQTTTMASSPRLNPHLDFHPIACFQDFQVERAQFSVILEVAGMRPINQSMDAFPKLKCGNKRTGNGNT